MELMCEFCKKELKTMSALNKHKKTAKYCLKLQNKNAEINIDSKEKAVFNHNFNLNNEKNQEFQKSETENIINPPNKLQNKILNNNMENIDQNICEFCERKFTNKYNLRNHKLCCKEIKQQKVEELNCYINNKNFEISQLQMDIINLKNIINNKNNMIEKLEFIKEKNEELISNQMIKITELEDRLERLGTKAINRSTTTNNTINLQLNNYISQEHINTKIADKFNDKYISNGIKGVAQFVYDHIITTEDGSVLYACYDVSRKIFKYKDTEGNEVKDVKATKLINMIKPGLIKQTDVLYDYFSEEYDYLKKMEEIKDFNNNDLQELYKIKYLKDKAIEVSLEINTMDKTNKFSNELANLAS
jgi:hypothetical protein